MKLANGLSLARIALVPPIMILILNGAAWSYLAASALFLMAALTDSLDGYFARRRRVVSKLGVFLDLTADKLLVSAVLVAFVQVQIAPAWAVATIIGREFMVSGLRTYAAAEGLVVPAGRWGKRKTVITNIAILILLVTAYWVGSGRSSPLEAAGEWGVLLDAGWWLLLVAVFLTVVSGAQYLVQIVPLLRQRKVEIDPASPWDP